MAKSKVKNRILFLSGQWADMGGLNRMIVTISTLIASDYDVTICSLDVCGPNDGYPIPDGVQYIEFPSSALYEFEKIIIDLNIDVFVGSNNCDIPYLNMYKKLSELNIRTVMWNHESFFLPYTQKTLYSIANYRKEIYKYLNAIVWLTETSAIACRQYSDKVVVIGNCIDDRCATNVQITAGSNQRLHIISLGRFDSKQKGIGYLLMMFSELLNINSNATLTVVGKYDMSMTYSDNTNETVSQLLSRLSIPKENIIFTGQVSNPSELIQESTFNVMVSETEGFGLGVLEAAAYGVPSVVFSGGGQEEIIQDGVNGLVIQYGDYALMAKIIADNFEDKAAYKAMSQCSLDILAQYSQSTIREKWIKLFNEVIIDNKIGGGVINHSSCAKVISNYERLLLKLTANTAYVGQKKQPLNVTSLPNVISKYFRSNNA